MTNLNLKLVLVGFLALTACGKDLSNSTGQNSAQNTPYIAGMPGTAGGVTGTPGTIGGTSGTPGTVGSGTLNPAPLANDPNNIRGLFDQYLPGCWTQEKQAAWQNFFTNGGTQRDFVFTLQIVRDQNPTCLIGRSTVPSSDPHSIHAYFDYYLPGCWTQEKQAAWQNFFNNGGTDVDFYITLQQVAATRPSCMR